MKLIDLLSSSVKFLNPDIKCIDLVDNGAETSIVIANGNFEEKVTINSPYYRSSSHVAFLPIMYDLNSKSIIMSSPVSGKIIVGLSQGSIPAVKLRSKIPLGWFIRKELDRLLNVKTTTLGITKTDINECFKMFESGNFGNVPNCTNVAEMTVYHVGDLIIEYINFKIADAMGRSRYPGYNGKMITYGLQEYLNTQVCQYIARTVNGNEEINRVDIASKVILPNEVKGLKLENNRFLAVNDSPQSEDSGRVCHLLYNASFDEETKRFNHKGDFIPASKLQATSPYFRNTFSNRMQVRRACVTQSLGVLGYEEPIVTSKYNDISYIPGTNLHTAFMQYGFTVEDGIIVSKSAADKLAAAKIHEEVIEGLDIDFKIKPLEMNPNDIIKNFRELFKLHPESHLIRKGAIANSKLGLIKTTNKKPSIVYSIEKEGTFTVQMNSGHGLVDITRERYIIRTVSFLKLETGDKLAGFYHGNKGTVAKIIADADMPIIDGHRVEVIMEPSICKRGIPSVAMECHDSMLARINGTPTVIDPNTPMNRDYALCQGKYYFDNDQKNDPYREEVDSALSGIFTQYIPDFNKVLHGWIRMSRLDHNSSEKLSFTEDADLDEDGNYRKGAIVLPGIQHVFYSAGCEAILKEMFEERANIDRLNKYLAVFSMDITQFK